MNESLDKLNELWHNYIQEKPGMMFGQYALPHFTKADLNHLVSAPNNVSYLSLKYEIEAGNITSI